MKRISRQERKIRALERELRKAQKREEGFADRVFSLSVSLSESHQTMTRLAESMAQLHNGNHASRAANDALEQQLNFLGKELRKLGTKVDKEKVNALLNRVGR